MPIERSCSPLSSPAVRLKGIQTLEPTRSNRELSQPENCNRVRRGACIRPDIDGAQALCPNSGSITSILSISERWRILRRSGSKRVVNSSLAEKFRKAEGHCLPTSFSDVRLEYRPKRCRERFRKQKVHQFGIRIHACGDYPPKVARCRPPVELLYSQGTGTSLKRSPLRLVWHQKPSPRGLKQNSATRTRFGGRQ